MNNPKLRALRPLNVAYCKQCNELLISVGRHDFVSCSGGHGSLDGGGEYVRVVGTLDKVLEHAENSLSKKPKG